MKGVEASWTQLSGDRCARVPGAEVDAPLRAGPRGARGRRPRRRHRLRLRVHRLRGRRQPTSPGFLIVHRYAYVLLPLEGEPVDRLPARGALRRRARRRPGSPSRCSSTRPGEWLAERLRGQRVGVYGLDHVDERARLPRARAGASSSSPGTPRFDHARAVKSELRARLGARERAHQHRGLLALPRGLRARPQRARDARPLRAAGSSRRAAGA